MNYYILPKNNIQIKIKGQFSEKNILDPYISQSVIRCFNHNQKQLDIINEFNNESDINIVNKILNTYEFILSVVPNSKLSVSKLKSESNIFFELIEIFHLCNINDILSNKTEIIITNISPNHTSCTYLLNIIREDKNDIYISEEFDINTVITFFLLDSSCKNLDFLFFEFNKEDYINVSSYFTNMILVLQIILKHQSNFGITIIKIDNIFYKVIIDVIYILAGLFEKVYIIKPSVSNSFSSERYIICKSFIPLNNSYKNNIAFKLSEIIKSYHSINNILESILENKISYFFISKIEESNIVIGQQQLEVLNQMINIIKNKNKDDKLEIIKRQNIQKCIQWCEKYKIPHNKFVDKINIFLNIKLLNDSESNSESNSEEIC
jgi:hypothetical protein